jgi:hypothetical protein
MSESAKNNIVILCNEAGQIAGLECERVGIPFTTPAQIALGSGLDVALTLMELSAGVFQGLSKKSARESVAYFRDEATRSEAVDIQIAIWYRSWAMAIERHFC